MHGERQKLMDEVGGTVTSMTLNCSHGPSLVIYGFFRIITRLCPGLLLQRNTAVPDEVFPAIEKMTDKDTFGKIVFSIYILTLMLISTMSVSIHIETLPSRGSVVPSLWNPR